MIKRTRFKLLCFGVGVTLFGSVPPVLPQTATPWLEWQLEGPVSSLYGSALASIADVDGDGLRELVIGAPWYSENGPTNGAVFAYTTSRFRNLPTGLHGRGDGWTGSLGWLNGFGASMARIEGDYGLVVGSPFYSRFGQPAIPSAGLVTFCTPRRSGGQLCDYRIPGDRAAGEFGSAVLGYVDVNQDGISDVVVGAPGSDPIQPQGLPSVFFVSGRRLQGSSILRVVPGGAGTRFGEELALAGDVDRDGSPDVFIAAPQNGNAGRVYMYSYAKSAYVWTAEAPRDANGFDYGFAKAIAAVGDVNRDGVPDVAVATTPGYSQGKVEILSGDTGAVIWSMERPGTDIGFFGSALEIIGDADNDGVADILVGSPYFSEGRVYLLSGSSGSVLHQIERPESFPPPYFIFPPSVQDFGHSLLHAGDLDGDGVQEIVVGANVLYGDGQAPRPSLFVYALGTPTCTDGTPYGQCSATKPLFCDNGALVPRSNVCGCPTGTVALPDGTCTACARPDDATPRIAYWWGKVNQHMDANCGWQTDADGSSGANLDPLVYCQKWYPSTSSVEDYRLETITDWKAAGNTGSYVATVMTQRCVQSSTKSTPSSAKVK